MIMIVNSWATIASTGNLGVLKRIKNRVEYVAHAMIGADGWLEISVTRSGIPMAPSHNRTTSQIYSAALSRFLPIKDQAKKLAS